MGFPDCRKEGSRLSWILELGKQSGESRESKAASLQDRAQHRREVWNLRGFSMKVT